MHITRTLHARTQDEQRISHQPEHTGKWLLVCTPDDTFKPGARFNSYDLQCAQRMEIFPDGTRFKHTRRCLTLVFRGGKFYFANGEPASIGVDA
jgi:hypothetical protein